MKTRLILFFLALIFTFHFAEAQYRPSSASKSSFMDKVYFGGGGSLGGGSNLFSISVSPLVGYKFTEQFSAGMQLTYQFTRFFGNSYSDYGGGPFVRYNITQNLFGYAQYEYLNFARSLNATGETVRIDFNSFFVGGGYSTPVGKSLSLNVMALYNLLYGDGTNTPYASPLQFRMGIVAGL